MQTKCTKIILGSQLPKIIFVHSVFAADDCALGAENMMLAADFFGMGFCYIGARWTD